MNIFNGGNDTEFGDACYVHFEEAKKVALQIEKEQGIDNSK
jgi:hypothetical protein